MRPYSFCYDMIAALLWYHGIFDMLKACYYGWKMVTLYS